jgi:predicted small secreted protein
MLKRIAAVAALAGFVMAAGGCNTIEGAGKDVKATGQAIEKAAGSAKSK